MIKLGNGRARNLASRIATLLFCLVLIGYAMPTPAVAQSGGKARIYVLRSLALQSALYTADILLNDVKAGSVANGSYVAIDRPPGRYTMKVRFTAIDLAPPQYTFHAQAGRTYYFSINSAAMPVVFGHGGFFMIPGSSMGKPVGESNPLLSGIHIGELDARTGAAELARFKAR